MTLQQRADTMTPAEVAALRKNISLDVAEADEKVLFLMLTLKLSEADAREALASEEAS